MDLNIDTVALKRVAIEAGKAGLPFLEQAVSAALVGVAGPFGMLVSPALNLLFPQINDLLGLAPDTPPDQTAAKIASDPEAAKAALDVLDSKQQFELAKQTQADSTALASQAQQAALLTLDTSSQSWFQRFPRAALIWGLGAVLLLSSILPYVAWFAGIAFGAHWPDPPQMGAIALSFLSALLALGISSKSYENGKKADAVKAVAGASAARR